jgi:hypothetical protein
MGDSVGRWEGDALVVDVAGYNDKTRLGPPGSFHSDALHVTERYTLTPENRLHCEVTLEDPKVLNKPWKMTSVDSCIFPAKSNQRI